MPGIIGYILMNRYLDCWYVSFGLGVCVYYLLDMAFFKRYSVHIIETYLPAMEETLQQFLPHGSTTSNTDSRDLRDCQELNTDTTASTEKSEINSSEDPLHESPEPEEYAAGELQIDTDIPSEHAEEYNTYD